MTVARPPVVRQTDWDAALAALTEREQAVATAMDELAAARKRMPMVRVQHQYRFDSPDGRRSLPELFDGRSQLILYRFFFEEGVDGWRDSNQNHALVDLHDRAAWPTCPSRQFFEEGGFAQWHRGLH